MNRLLGLLLLISIGWGLTGCDKVTEPGDQFYDTHYFPLAEGATFWYTYDSVWVDCVAGRRDTFKWEMREEMDSFFVDASGAQAMLLKVSKRNAGTTNWGPPRIYSMKLEGNNAIRTEENIRYIKLRFPVSLGQTWNGNLFNTLDWGNDYEITEFNTPSLGFDSTLLVNQKDQSNLLERKLFTERYARHVGLVQRVAIDVTGIVTDPLDPNDCEEFLPPATPWNTIPILQRIKLGYVVQKVLVDYQL
jgi:hypothetical protein